MEEKQPEPVVEEEPEIKAPFGVIKLDELPDVPADSPVHIILPPEISIQQLADACENESTKDLIVIPESAIVTP